MPWQQCRTCEAWFVQRGTGSPVYCSDDCRLTTTDPGTGTCVECGTPFQHTPTQQGQQIYCARTCARKAARRRHRERFGSDSYRTRARRAGTPYTPFNVQDIYERDGWRCGICHRKVNPALTYPHPMSVSLDHIVPLNPTDKGAHVPENTRCSHLRCNVERGRGGTAQLMLATASNMGGVPR